MGSKLMEEFKTTKGLHRDAAGPLHCLKFIQKEPYKDVKVNVET
jgi:hypothetical protein